MSELDKNQLRIDWYLQNNNFKQAINYVTALKQKGMSPENISLLQVYISKKMNQSTSKSTTIDSTKKIQVKNQSSKEYNSPRQLTNNSPRGVQLPKFQIQFSQPYIADGTTPSSFNKINNTQKSSQSSHQITFTQQQEQYNIDQQRRSSKEINQQSNKMQIKQLNRSVKLPSLNNIENEQYIQLKGVIKESIKDLNGKINLKYFKSNALLEQANYFNKRKEYDKAIEYYDQAMEVDTNNLNILMGKGDCLRKQGQFEAALECYEYAMNLNPPHKFQFKILFNKGNVLKCLGKNKEAIECYSKASLLDPANPNTYFNKALTFYSLGELDDAIDNYSRVLKNNPRDQHAFLNKGNKYISSLRVLQNKGLVYKS